MHARTLGAAIALSVTAVTANAQTPSWTVPPESARCPSKWGAGDERGSANLMKPQLVLDAVKLIKSGEIIELAHVLGPAMPFFGTRRFDVHVKRTFMNTGSNERGSNEEMVLSEIGQVGTQQPLQLLQDRGDRGARPVQQARHPERRRVHHARRADRRRGFQGRRDAG